MYTCMYVCMLVCFFNSLNEDVAYKKGGDWPKWQPEATFSQLKMDAKFIYYYFIVVNNTYSQYHLCFTRYS